MEQTGAHRNCAGGEGIGIMNVCRVAALGIMVVACTDRETLIEPARSPVPVAATADASSMPAPVAVLAPIAMTRVPAASDDADSFIERAERALKAHDLDRADSLAREAIRRDDESPDAWVVVGDVAFERKRPADALAAYDRALTVDPKHSWAAVRASDALGALGRSEEARTRLRAFIAKNGNADSDVFDALGWAELDSQDIGRATDAFRHSLAMTGDTDADAWYGLAVVAADGDNPNEVARMLARVFALDPGRRSEALHDEAFESVRHSQEWKALFE